MKIVNINRFRLLISLVLFLALFPRKYTNAIFVLVFLLSLIEIIPSLVSGKINIKGINGKAYFSIILIVIYALFNFIINYATISSFERLFQLILCLITILASANHQWNDNDIKYLKFNVYFLLLLMFFSWIFSGFQIATMYTNKNSFGGALMCIIPLIFLCNKKMHLTDYVLLLIALSLLVISGNRSVLISIFVFLIGKYVFSLCNKYKINYLWVFIVAIALALFVPLLYVSLWHSPLRSTLNNFSFKYFNKSFFSGRQVLWSEALLYINQKKWFGYGLGVTLQNFFRETRSVHNWYLQTVLQMGIIGLSILMYFFKKVWNILYDNRNYFVCRNTLAFLIGVVIWQCFEVSLTHNNLPTGIVVWLVLGIGLNGKNFAQILDNMK